MKYSTRIRSISYLKANAAEVVRELAEQREPLVITQNGEAKAVIQDVASFEQTQETLALLKILALGNRQIEAQDGPGRGGHPPSSRENGRAYWMKQFPERRLAWLPVTRA